MIDVTINAFSTNTETVEDFFQPIGRGLYIPLYQREYSWDKDNINQLMEDIYYGVSYLLDNDQSIHFMGTIIQVQEKNNIKLGNQRDLPTKIDSIIDGLSVFLARVTQMIAKNIIRNCEVLNGKNYWFLSKL